MVMFWIWGRAAAVRHQFHEIPDKHELNLWLHYKRPRERGKTTLPWR